MLKITFGVKFKNKETGKTGYYTCNKIVISMVIAEAICDKYNRLGQIGPIEYTYKINATEIVGFVANLNECIYKAQEA